MGGGRIVAWELTTISRGVLLIKTLRLPTHNRECGTTRTAADVRFCAACRAARRAAGGGRRAAAPRADARSGGVNGACQESSRAGRGGSMNVTTPPPLRRPADGGSGAY